MNIKTSVSHTFTKFLGHKKILSKVRPLSPRSINLVRENCFEIKNTKHKPCTTTIFYPNSLYKTYPHNDLIKIRFKDNFLNLKNTIKIARLRWKHDPNFDVESFKKGANQAMSVITKSIKENKGANRYLSESAYEYLKKISNKWKDIVKSNIALEPDQIYHTLIVDINHDKLLDSTLYQIQTLGLGIRPFNKSDDYYVETIILAIFERKYGRHEIPEWNTTMFDILKMTILSLK